MGQQKKDKNVQPTEYVVPVPESDAQLEINIRHPRKNRNRKEKM